jgi:hypothetical protein
MKTILVLVPVLMILCGTTPSKGWASDYREDGFGPEGDSGIRGPAYETLVREYEVLETRNPDLVERRFYGLSQEGRPLISLKVSRRDRVATQAIAISGTIHGDEYLNIEDRLPGFFLEEARRNNSETARYLDQGGVFYLTPILNPDGYSARRRTSAGGKDLNREFPLIVKNHAGLREQEIISFVELLDRELAEQRIPLKLGWDYHCCLGALLYPWSFRGLVLPPADLELHVAIGRVALRAFGKTFRVGTTPVLLGYDAIGTSKDFYYERYGALGFTYEGVRTRERTLFPSHTGMWKEILKAFLRSPERDV